MKKFIYKNCGLLAITWILVVFGLCSMPGQYIPSVSWLELLSFDKWVHAGIFFTLCSFLFVFAIKKKQSFYACFVYFLSAVIYGGLLEIMQALVFSHRSSDWQDFVANTFGCFVALLLFRKTKKVFAPFVI